MIRRFLLILLAAALFHLSAASSLLSFAVWFFLIPFVLAFQGLNPAKAFCLGWFGAILFASFFLKIVFYTSETGASNWASVTMLLMLFFLATFPYAFFAYSVVKFDLLRMPSASLSAAALLVILVFAFDFVFPGSLVIARTSPSYLIQILDIGGVPLLLFCIYFFNIALAAAWINRAHVNIALRFFSMAFLTVAIPFVYGVYRFHHLSNSSQLGTHFRLGLVQANYPLDLPESIKSDYYDKNHSTQTFQQLIDVSSTLAKQSLDILIWPEIPYPINMDWYWDKQSMERLAKETHAFLLFSGSKKVTSEDIFPSKNYVVAYFLNQEGQLIGLQKKIHLFPIGEYLPFEKEFPWLRKTFTSAGSSTAGEKMIVVPIGNGQIRLASLICYDAIYPENIRQAKLDGANVFFNLANDGWFGKSDVSFYTLNNVVFQAISFRAPFVRVANTGISAVIDERGKILISSGRELYKPKTLVYDLPIQTSYSFFAHYPHVIWIFLYGLLGFIFLPKIFSRRSL